MIKDGEQTPRRKCTDNQPEMPYSYDELVKNQGSTVAELLEIGDYETVLSIMKKDPFIESWISLQNGYKAKSITIARNAMAELVSKPEKDDNRWKLLYPVYYADELNKYSQINNLDPVLMLSLMREESHFNPTAVSVSNALGLMQLLHGTANDVTRWNNLSPVSRIQLFDPKTNITLGTAYFKYAKNRLNNTALYAVAGYNSGPGAVERWLKTMPYNDLDQFIENIPYDQTRNYVKKVYGSYWNYNRIYNL
ncbi:MAG: lytic transglycosylase domain-containing protein [Desulfobacterales bacterium]|nr:lytic transglycosylase domain-containing protein [Desulfobacterales bacterium]